MCVCLLCSVAFRLAAAQEKERERKIENALSRYCPLFAQSEARGVRMCRNDVNDVC